MDNLTLSDKIAIVDACERLMVRGKQRIQEDNRVALHEEDEETVGYDFSSMDGDNLRKLENARERWLDSIESDPLFETAMDELSLSEKVAVVSACERLIVRYNKRLEEDNINSLRDENEETVGYDFGSIDRDRLENFRNVREAMLGNIESDSLFVRAVESQGISK